MKNKSASKLNLHNFLSVYIVRISLVALILFSLSAVPSESKPYYSMLTLPFDSVLIGNYLVTAPDGIAFIVNNSAAFVMDTGGPYVAGTAAPDGSFNLQRIPLNGAHIVFQWGRVGDAVVGRFDADKTMQLTIHLSSGWPGWISKFSATSDGVNGRADAASSSGGTETAAWQLRTDPAPVSSSDNQVMVDLSPGKPVRFVAGFGRLTAFNQVDRILILARKRYEAHRPSASGDWGDFLGAIADNMNNSRIYSSDNHMLAHSVSRGWAGGNPNQDPYFCWDSFFTANLASLDDLHTAENTVRAILSYQTRGGLVPNFAHTNSRASDDRSQPPVGALCVWKIYQRWGDKRFLSEVYPKLVKWHNWWPKTRDGNHNELLEWGSSTGVWQNAQFETGWDDNLHFAGTSMVGANMDADAVDLSSMWSMDARYLSYIADMLGHKSDAAKFRMEQLAMNQRINRMLWNDKMGLYCSRMWNGRQMWTPVEPSAFAKGFAATFYTDENLQNEAAQRNDASIDFDWNGSSPAPGVANVHWSARWTATFTPPETGDYRFTTLSDDGVRLYVNGRLLIDDWVVQPAAERHVDIHLVQASPVSIKLEYFQHEFNSTLHLTVFMAKKGDFLTRITPMNFYPLIAGVPDKSRAKRVMRVLTNPHKFWGTWVIPTLSYDDPDYHQQEYWRGDIWGPTNYLIFQGLRRYVTPNELDDFADKSVRLFMRNWTKSGLCGENYLSTDGSQNHDPHYTWGALLDMIGLESIYDILPDGSIWLNGVQSRTITMRNLPIHGKLYEIRISPGKAEILFHGKAVLVAKNRVTVGKL